MIRLAIILFLFETCIDGQAEELGRFSCVLTNDNVFSSYDYTALFHNVQISEADMTKGYLILTVDGPNHVNDQHLPVSGNLAFDIEDKVDEGMMPGQNLHGQ